MCLFLRLDARQERKGFHRPIEGRETLCLSYKAWSIVRRCKRNLLKNGKATLLASRTPYCTWNLSVSRSFPADSNVFTIVCGVVTPRNHSFRAMIIPPCTTPGPSSWSRGIGTSAKKARHPAKVGRIQTYSGPKPLYNSMGVSGVCVCVCVIEKGDPHFNLQDKNQLKANAPQSHTHKGAGTCIKNLNCQCSLRVLKKMWSTCSITKRPEGIVWGPYRVD